MVYYKNIDDSSTVGFLGNKLFDLAAAYSLAIRNNVKLVLPYSELDTLFQTKFFENMNKNDIIPKKEYHEPHFHFAEIPYTEGINLNGYFQSYKYFDELSVKNAFIPSFDIQKHVISFVINKINTSFSSLIHYEKVCAIHVRRGDYLNLSSYHTNLDLNYYRLAIEEVKKRDKIDYFLIFSNDLPWCKAVFNGDEFLFAESVQDKQQGNISSAIDLFMQSQCHHNIIANSSFSWWSAYLNKNPKKIVVSPGGASYNWFGPALKHDTKDLIPESWIRI